MEGGGEMSDDKIIIQSITEAYSMQPAHFHLGMGFIGQILTRIEVEQIAFPGGEEPYCVGYDEYGNKMFEFRKETVNIIYRKAASK